MSTFSHSYKVIISLANMELDASLKDGLKCKINVEGEIKISDVPFREVYCFDLSNRCSHILITFTMNKVDIAEAKIQVPEKIKSLTELETSEKIRLPVKNVESELPYISASFN